MSKTNKRQDILQAAIKVYGYYGFEGATIERIAEHAGVSRALVLRYYASKQELVRAVVDHVAGSLMDTLHRLDNTPGLTLRQRTNKVFEVISPLREEWCLTLGTLLVPNFQFQLKGTITGYAQTQHEGVMRHIHELKDPVPESAFALAYALSGLFFNYVIGGKQDNYRRARDQLLDTYLLPEEQIKAQM